jgi:hypothetical protein
VRSNSARALGDMKAHAAELALVALLRGEQDGGVIEQASLALRVLAARDAVPVFRSKASHRCQCRLVLKTRPQLVDYLTDDNWNRKRA